ncbi:MAG: response regulator, partial [Actinobacteria bacterium]|nr:response regulator [Actinomycetota bacterium]NBR76643.1 response regulator [Actinomycetota bacterium]NBR92880.1 response regulator [Actinomycetota bacterium]
MKSHGWRVLVAEDDAAVRSAVVRVLELDGYRVQAVKDGRAAL